MYKKIAVSAPGKLMLLGEYAVLDDEPCLVTAVGQRLSLTMQQISTDEFCLEAKDAGVTQYRKNIQDVGMGVIPHGARFVELAVRNFLHTYGKQKLSGGLHITTTSGFGTTTGLGSSSASAVCAMQALSLLLNTHLNQKALFDLSYKTVLDVQKKGSGFDIAAAVYGGTLYFKNGGEIIESLDVDRLPLVIGYSGQKADTAKMIGKVEELRVKNPTKITGLYQKIGTLAGKAKNAIAEENWQEVGRYMTTNQAYLEELEVSTERLDSMIQAALRTGAYGAKISGAGGGDCMIALVAPERKDTVRLAIEKAGGTILTLSSGAEGVRSESI